MTVFLEEPVDEKEQTEAAQKKTEDALGSYDLFDKEVNLKCISAKNPFDPQHPFTGSLTPVVQKVDSSIRGLNLYPLDSAIGFPNTYPLCCVPMGGVRRDQPPAVYSIKVCLLQYQRSI